MENFKQRVIGKPCLGAEMFHNHPQGLGKIYENPDSRLYEPEPNAIRPWKGYVTKYLKGGGDRCHSFSYWGMTQVCCDYLNNPRRDPELIRVLKETLGPWLSSKFTLAEKTERAVTAYETNLNSVWKSVEGNLNMENLNKLLDVLNSSILNLRLPANNSLHWNRSVSNCYDVRNWCYIDENIHVISDQNSLGGMEENPSDYEPLKKFPGEYQPWQQGFYLISDIDHYILYGLSVMGRYLQNPSNYLFFSMGQEDAPYLASSSNFFERPAREQGFSQLIYTYNWDDNAWNVICAP